MTSSEVVHGSVGKNYHEFFHDYFLEKFLLGTLAKSAIIIKIELFIS